MNSAIQISQSLSVTGIVVMALPMHHGLTVFLMSLTAVVGACLVAKMFVGQRDMF